MEQVGTLLRQMRTAAGFSLGALARTAGVGKATLSQWEAGHRQPRVTELEAVLGALHVDAGQRALVFSRVEAPRALRYLREHAAPTLGLSAPPTSGDLLRALRLRKGWSQAQVAAGLGVTRTTVTQWERSERQPSSERLVALCFVLEAQEDELVALTCGGGRMALSLADGGTESDEEDNSAQDVEALAALVERLFDGSEARTELEYLDLIARTWRLTARQESAHSLLARCYFMYADHLSLQQRWQEMGRYARLGLDLRPCSSCARGCESFWIVGAVTAAHHAVHQGARLAPERGLRVLQHWLPLATQPAHQAWIQSRMAEYLLMEGATEAARSQGVLACQTVERSERFLDVRRRIKDHAVVLTQAGFAADALPLLEPAPNDAPAFVLDLRLWQVKAYLALEQRAAGHACLARAYGLCHEHGLPTRLADDLACRF